jgi:hypothetical protein
VTHLCTSGTTSQKPFSSDWLVLCVGDAKLSLQEVATHVTELANLHTAWLFLANTCSDSGSESLDKQEPRDILHCHVERRDQSFAVAESRTIGLRISSLYCTAFNVVWPILKQRHRTARLSSARSCRRWRLHSCQHILFSDQPEPYLPLTSIYNGLVGVLGWYNICSHVRI